jgi:nuclear transport factor 2 (NTF2) superfamily protein
VEVRALREHLRGSGHRLARPAAPHYRLRNPHIQEIAMAVKDPNAWVKNVERLYRAYDADGVSALYTADATTRFGSRVMTPEQVHAHPKEWFDSLEEYEIVRTFRAATGDIIVSETTASYIKKEDGKRYREFGIDVYWVNDEGKIYHKHTSEVVEPYGLRELTDLDFE